MTLPRPEGGAQQALAELLNGQRRWRRSPAVLTVGAALEELAVTLEEAAAGRSPLRSTDRRSLVCDVDLALTRCGPALQDATSPGLRRLRVDDVARLEDVLAARSGSAALAETVRAVLEQLRSDDALRGAWADALARFADPGTMVSELVLSVDQLDELLRSRGHELWVAHSTLRERVRAGDWDLADHELTTLADEQASVAWVAFSNASLGATIRRVGQVRFFDGRPGLRALRDHCDRAGDELREPMPELDDETTVAHLDAVPGEHLVLARVELTGPRAAAPEGGYRMPQLEWARRLASELVEVAGFSYGGTEWVLLDGGCTFLADGRDGDASEFGDPDERARNERLADPRFDPTADQLAGLPEGFAAALAAGRPAAREAVSWHRNVEKTTDLRQRLALHVRRFEVQWSTGDPGGWGTWEEPLRHYLRDAWSRHQQDDLLMFAGYRMHCDAALAHPKAGVPEAVAGVYESEGSHGFSINLRATVAAVRAVAGGFPGGSLHRRLLKEVGRRTARPARTGGAPFVTTSTSC